MYMCIMVCVVYVIYQNIYVKIYINNISTMLTLILCVLHKKKKKLIVFKINIFFSLFFINIFFIIFFKITFSGHINH